MKRLLVPLVVLMLAACDGGGGSTQPAEDTAPVDAMDTAAGDAAPDVAPDVPPDAPPDVPPDTPPDVFEGCTPEEHDGGDGTCVPLGTCAPGFVLGGDGVCVPEGSCSAGYHDGGEGICVPEGECSHGFADGGDGSCVPEGTCAAGYHDGGDGACLPEGTCIPGFFDKPEGGGAACAAEVVVSDPEIGGRLPLVLWDGTGATMIWYAPGEPGKWMKLRMTFTGALLGTPAPMAMDVAAPGAMAAVPMGSGLLAVWEQSGGILRCMRVQQDGSSTTNTLATDGKAGPGEAWLSVVPEAAGALVAWVDAAGAPALARVDDACQVVWGPEAPPLPGGEAVLGAPAVAVKSGLTLVGWAADDGAGEGYHRVLAYDAAMAPGEAQTWQDGPGVVEAGLRLFPRTLGFGFHGLTLGPFGGGVPTPILRDLDKDGVPKASPSAPIPIPPAPVTEPWAAALTDDLFTVAWADGDTGTVWLAAFHGDGAVAIEPTPVSVHGPGAAPALGPGSLAPIPGVGHALLWSSALTGQDEIYVAIIDTDGVRLY